MDQRRVLARPARQAHARRGENRSVASPPIPAAPHASRSSPAAPHRRQHPRQRRRVYTLHHPYACVTQHDLDRAGRRSEISPPIGLRSCRDDLHRRKSDSRGNRRRFWPAPRHAAPRHLTAPCRQHIRIDAVSRRDFRHFCAGHQTLSHDHRFAGCGPPSPARTRVQPTFTAVAKQAVTFHHAIHRRTLRQSATDDIISTRAQNL
jgi:hypothetical protein